MTQPHSPEPWNYGDLLTDKDGEIIFDRGWYEGEQIDPSDEDWERIVACVNACAGIPTEVLTMHKHPVIFLSDWMAAYFLHNANSIPEGLPVDCSTFRKFAEQLSKMPELPKIVCSKCGDKLKHPERMS
jgi:hypothetical protein